MIHPVGTMRCHVVLTVSWISFSGIINFFCSHWSPCMKASDTLLFYLQFIQRCSFNDYADCFRTAEYKIQTRVYLVLNSKSTRLNS